MIEWLIYSPPLPYSTLIKYERVCWMPLPKDSMFFGLADKLTDEQREFADSILDNRLTITNSPSGTGKTTIAIACAKLLQRDLVYVFSPVEEDKIGFTPGSVQEKEAKYIQPLIDALLEIGENPQHVIYDEENLAHLKNGKVWVYPKSHIFVRGMNIKGKTVIIDECQNFTRGELKKLLTRIHDDCKVIMIGHSLQCDLKNPSKSGFIPYIEHYKDESYVKVCNLTRNFRGELAQHADKLSW